MITSEFWSHDRTWLLQQVPGQFLPLYAGWENVPDRGSSKETKPGVSVAVGPIKPLRMRSGQFQHFSLSILRGHSCSLSCSHKRLVRVVWLWGRVGGAHDKAGEMSGQGSGCWAGLEAPAFSLEQVHTFWHFLQVMWLPESSFSSYTLSSSGLQSHEILAPFKPHWLKPNSFFFFFSKTFLFLAALSFLFLLVVWAF